MEQDPRMCGNRGSHNGTRRHDLASNDRIEGRPPRVRETRSFRAASDDRTGFTPGGSEPFDSGHTPLAGVLHLPRSTAFLIAHESQPRLGRVLASERRGRRSRRAVGSSDRILRTGFHYKRDSSPMPDGQKDRLLEDACARTTSEAATLRAQALANSRTGAKSAFEALLLAVLEFPASLGRAVLAAEKRA